MSRRAHEQTDVAEKTATSASQPTEAEEIALVYLEPLFTNSANAIIIIDEHFQILEFNPSTTEKLNWSRETTIGKKCQELLKCRNLNGMELCGTSSCPLTRVMESNKPIPNEEMLLGTGAYASNEYALGVTPIVSKKGRAIVFSARDVSTLKVANSVRSNFVSMVSHELRT